MEFITELFNWFWALNTDALIIPFVKANAIILTAVGVIVRWWVKRTPSTEDDELLDGLMRVIPQLKKH